MVFAPDRKIVCIVQDREGTYIINLMSEVAGDTIITDQPYEPRKKHRKIYFESDDVLILDDDGTRTWFPCEG